MKKSESVQHRAAEIIERLVLLLDDENLRRQIDEPIEWAAQTFDCDVETPASQRQFNDVTAGFMRHLYAHMPACPRQLSPDQARDEAVALVELAYRPISTVPYDAALCEAIDDAQAGMATVLDRLAQALKAQCRQTFERWVFARYIDPFDWEINCAIAANLLDRARLPSAPATYRPRPELLVDDIPELLKATMTVDQFGQSAFSPTIARPPH